jgi:hypothetical protein
MCWALAFGFVLARPASDSPELLELDEDPELPLELPEVPELPDPELPQAATNTAHAAAIAASRSAPAVFDVIFSIVHNLPRTRATETLPSRPSIGRRHDQPLTAR